MKSIEGTAFKHELTKRLIQKIYRDCIAVIKHRDIDLVAAQDLNFKRVKAVINCEKTLDSQSIGDGVKYLIDNGIKVYDVYDKFLFNKVHDGDFISIINNMLYVNNNFFAICFPVLKDDIVQLNSIKSFNDVNRKCDFIRNTIEFLSSELEYFVLEQALPDLYTHISGKDVLIVSRGRGYREDLKCIKRFILKKRPILVGVDGGADALLDIGFKSHIVIGDMDSVSDKSLMSCGEIVVHSYCSGYAPGLHRLKERGLDCKLIQLKGTSEDAAVYMAKLKGASKIYLVGSHTGIDEFIEKGRKGMGSTALLRMLFGASIVDLKGISSIEPYRSINYIKASMMFAFVLLIIFMAASYINFYQYIRTQLKILIDII